MKTRGELMQRLVRVLKSKGPLRTGDVGFELWSVPACAGHDENIQSTMFVRPASKLLGRAEKLGLVRWQQHGKSRVWSAQPNARVSESSAEG